MKKHTVVLLVIIAVVTAMVGLAGCSQASTTDDSPLMISTNELVSAIDGKKVYLYDDKYGIAASDAEAKLLATQADSGSMFDRMLNGGHRSIDSKTGIVFVTEGDSCTLHGAYIWVVEDGTSLDTLMALSVNGPVRVAGRVNTDFGKIKVCLLDL